MDHSPYHVAVDHSLVLSPLQHGAVPLDQTLWLGNLLLRRVAMEDVVISFARGACPNMGSAEPALVNTKMFMRCPHAHMPPPHSPLLLHKFHVTNDDLVVDESPVFLGLEEVYTVQVGDIHTPGGKGGGEQGVRRVGTEGKKGAGMGREEEEGQKT